MYWARIIDPDVSHPIEILSLSCRAVMVNAANDALIKGFFRKRHHLGDAGSTHTSPIPKAKLRLRDASCIISRDT